jgi:hypothetical protein
MDYPAKCAERFDRIDFGLHAKVERWPIERSGFVNGIHNVPVFSFFAPLVKRYAPNLESSQRLFYGSEEPFFMVRSNYPRGPCQRTEGVPTTASS